MLNACVSVVVLEEGWCAHEQIFQSGWDSIFFMGNSLVGIEDAGIVFIKIPSQNVVTLTTMILGHVQCGQGQKVLELLQQMQ
jgi:pentatricopeptide repeat protein